MAQTVIEIIGKNKGKTEVLDEANSRNEAKSQVNYWRRLRPGWRITTRAK